MTHMVGGNYLNTSEGFGVANRAADLRLPVSALFRACAAARCELVKVKSAFGSATLHFYVSLAVKLKTGLRIAIAHNRKVAFSIIFFATFSTVDKIIKQSRGCISGLSSYADKQFFIHSRINTFTASHTKEFIASRAKDL
ncbi:MAG: hypothetical protein QM709_12415 [Spongiibacteraceae bacterium]